ncbi:hypothetical protein D3C71_1399290 [compost metagenome]
MGGFCRFQRERVRVKQRHELARLDQPRRLAQNLAVMLAALARQQWQQGEDTGVSRPAKGKRCQAVLPPPQATEHMTVIHPCRLE